MTEAAEVANADGSGSGSRVANGVGSGSRSRSSSGSGSGNGSGNGGDPKPLEPAHLVILQHGLWGHPDNLQFLEKLFLAHAESCADLSCPVRTVNSSVNFELLTYDGIDVCGERVVALIKETIKRLAEREGLRVAKLSLLGYSLGGLIMRYAVGRLEHDGMFAEGGIQPVNFWTVATPHLGSVRTQPSLYNRVYNSMVPVMSSHTGYQLVLKDKHAYGRPLLINMCDPELAFVRGLSRFRVLMAVGNIRGDQMVPFTSATMRASDPYSQSSAWARFKGLRARPAADPKRYPNVLRPVEDLDGDDIHGEERGRAEGWAVGVLVLVLLPLALVLLVLLMCFLAYKGLTHHRASSLEDLVPYAWAEQKRARAAGGGQASAPRMSCDEAPANGSSTREPAAIDQPLGERDVSTTSRVGLGAAPGAGAAPAGGGGGVPECVLSDTLAAEGIDVGIAPGRADASAGGECTASGDDGDGAAAAGLSVLPAAAGTEARLTWMLEQLNTLPWQKVDVDCRHMHAHAAIVVRKVWHGTQFRVHDHLHYMLDQAEW